LQHAASSVLLLQLGAAHRLAGGGAGERMLRDEDVREDIQPESINPLGNYAVQISWQDGFNQVASFELLEGLRHMALDPRAPVPSL
jgi:DUF971 family protein